MKKELFNELLQSVNEAAAIERGDAKPSRKFEVKTANDVVRVRNKLGLPQTKFARLLGISAKTVETHRSQVMERLHIYDLVGLVRYALREKITRL